MASAEAVPAQDTQMSFLISGPIEEVLVKEGDVVTAGQSLLTLYSPDLELSVTSSRTCCAICRTSNINIGFYAMTARQNGAIGPKPSLMG
ncbi:MAG: biotin/lipoyl-binding protein [Anaerolineales bacterium]|nr:biotin/lipoyl-binding protein [Anaerolineales bacterium]